MDGEADNDEVEVIDDADGEQGADEAGLVKATEKGAGEKADKTAEPEAGDAGDQECEDGEAEPDREGEDGDAKAGERKKGEKSDLPPEIQRKIDARIEKEIGKRKDLQDQLDRSEARIRELEELAEEQAAAGGGRAKRGLSGLSERELARRESELREFVEWADDALDEMGTDAEATVEVSGKEYTRADIKARRREMRHELEESIPAARQANQERAKVRETIVKEAYPDLLDPKSEAAITMRQAARMFPDLAGHPQFEVMIGDMLAGARLREEKTSAKTKAGQTDKTTDKGKKPAPVPKPGAAAAPTGKPSGEPNKKTSPNLAKILDAENDDDLADGLGD
jgi:hypothetical protein